MFRISLILIAAVLVGLLSPACLGLKVAAQDAQSILQLHTLLLHSGDSRHLQSDACSSELSQAQSCLDSSIPSSEVDSCNACYKQALESAENSLSGSTSFDCQDLDKLICTPIESCSCLGKCASVFGDALECAFKAAYEETTGNSFACSVTCQNSGGGSSGGGSSSTIGSGSSGAGISIASGLRYGWAGMLAMAFALM
jgi:hypothetical protein